ncbi:MAG: hypothetical protein KGQ41_01175 [Alphaproteobacteria bacterium]|nr:hypothetical protein [Alphaproteobacteria bacterium]
MATKSKYPAVAALDWYEANVKGATAVNLDVGTPGKVEVTFETPKGNVVALLSDVRANRELIGKAFGREVYPKELVAAIDRHGDIVRAICSDSDATTTHAKKFRHVIS